MELDEPLPEYSQADIDAAFQDAIAAADRLHGRLTKAAEDAGYIKGVVRAAKPRLNGLYSTAHDDPDAYPIVASGVNFLKGLASQLNEAADRADEFITPIGPVVNSTGTFAMTSDSSFFIFASEAIEPPSMPPPPSRESRQHYSDKLRDIDQALSDSYDQVWQSLLATKSDPHRAALYMMRQVFDTFFAKLAPDDEVRHSRHWKPKEGDNPDLVWRSERVDYALEKHVHDGNRRAILAAETSQVAALYKAANMAHDRGALDEDKAGRALTAMDSFLKDWLDSLG